MIRIEENVPLAPLTTIGLGGVARYFLRATAEEDILEGLRFAREKNLPLFILGGGSNVVFADAGFAGLVLQIGWQGIEETRTDTAVRLSVQAGESWDGLVERCVAAGLAGMECLSGIPGQVGSVPVQNVGAYGQEVSSLIVKVDTLDCLTGAGRSFLNTDCQFSYRNSFFKTAAGQRYIIVRVHFTLERQSRPQIAYPELKEKVGSQASPAEVREAVLSLRGRKGMLVGPAYPRSCGSFFLNPILSSEKVQELQKQFPALPVYPATDGRSKVSAAFLIEACGISRGFRQGSSSATVSPLHSLSLVSEGKSAAELVSLARYVQDTIQKKTGVLLEMEPVVYPTDRFSR